MQFLIPAQYWCMPEIEGEAGGSGARLQVRKVTDKIIYVQGECRWKEVYWIYIFHMRGVAFKYKGGNLAVL